MKEEEIEPRLARVASSPKQGATQKKKKQKSTSETKIQKVNNNDLINPMVDPSKIREQNQKSFHAAQGQRKSVNSMKFKQYMEKRKESFQERQKICDLIRAMFFQKQKNIKEFIKNITKYFQDYANLYSNLSKSISKLQLKKKYENITMYSGMRQSLSELVKLNQEQNQHVLNFVDWLQKILIQAFKSAYNFFRQRVKKLNKDLEISEQNYNNLWSKQLKTYEKIADGNDILQKQLILLEHIKNTNQATINRAVDLYQTWEYLLEEQNTIKKLLKDSILQFHDRFVKFHKKTDSATAIFKYWSSLPASPNIITVFSSFLDDKHVQYINFGCKTQKLADNFQSFMRMAYQQKRVGNPYPFLDILIIKKFYSKLQISQRDWKNIKLIFSVDKNLLLVDQKQGNVIMKLMENSIKLKRISQNILQLNGLQEGIIFNSKKKQSIHFETLDEVQQFIYYVNSIPEQKKQDDK